MWFSLIDNTYEDQTLELAWVKVSDIAGTCSVDRISVGHFDKDTQNRLLDIKEHLNKGTYEPKPVKRVMIPKPRQKQKTTNWNPHSQRSRRANHCKNGHRTNIFEGEFAEQSYGFRPGRGCKDALPASAAEGPGPSPSHASRLASPPRYAYA